MSDKMIYIACFFPNEEFAQETGAMKTARAFEAANIRQARAKATMDFIEEHPQADDTQFSLAVYQDMNDIPRPDLDVWDYEFLYNHEWDNDKGHPVSSPELINFDGLQPNDRLCVLTKYGTTEITKSQLEDALELTMDDISTFEGHIVEAFIREGSIAAMYTNIQLELISSIKEKLPKTKKWPEILSYAKGWIKAMRDDRQNGVEDKNNSPMSDRPVRSYEHTHKTLDLEVAIAFWPGDVNPGNVDGEILRWAKSEVIERNREDWKRFSMAMRTQENVLKYDMNTVLNIVQKRPDDIHKNPVALNDYISNYLSEHGVYENETKSNNESTTSILDTSEATSDSVEQEQHDNAPAEGTMETAPPVDRQGPFYYRSTDSSNYGRANKIAKLEEMLKAGCVEIEKEEYLQLKNGVKADPQPTSPSSEETGKQLAAQRGEYVEGICDPNDPKWVKTETTTHQKGEAKLEVTEQASVIVPDTTFIVRADQLERELGDSENLKLWRSVMRTNPRYTKDLSGTGFEGTSINGEYMVMRATECFGPIGIGWGYEILEDVLKPGAPLSEAIYENNKFVGKKLIRDAEGNLITSLHHSMKISFWYIMEGQRGAITAYGATDYMYMTLKNGIKVDGEAQKKSLTDAIKKALSLLGFSADVWLGHYDDAAYKAESKMEFEIKDEIDKGNNASRIREELDERFKSNVETMRNAVSKNEVSKIASSLTRTIGVHLKTARDTADKDYAKYLEGRLNRLEAVKLECLKNLEEKA
jgi:hypothetical protein